MMTKIQEHLSDKTNLYQTWQTYLLLSTGKIHGETQDDRMRKMYPSEADLAIDNTHDCVYKHI